MRFVYVPDEMYAQLMDLSMTVNEPMEGLLYSIYQFGCSSISVMNENDIQRGIASTTGTKDYDKMILLKKINEKLRNEK